MTRAVSEPSAPETTAPEPTAPETTEATSTESTVSEAADAESATAAAAASSEQTLYLYYDADGSPYYSTDETSPTGEPGEPITPISCDDMSAVLTAKNGYATAVDGTPLPDCDDPEGSEQA